MNCKYTAIFMSARNCMLIDSAWFPWKLEVNAQKSYGRLLGERIWLHVHLRRVQVVFSTKPIHIETGRNPIFTTGLTVANPLCHSSEVI